MKEPAFPAKSIGPVHRLGRVKLRADVLEGQGASRIQRCEGNLLRLPTPTTLLARLIGSPDLARTVRALPLGTFAALVRHVGVEDAGEIVALATTDQLVAAFDEDLFVNTRPGERETFDPRRFVRSENPEAGYGRFLVSQLGEPECVVLVAERAVSA